VARLALAEHAPLAGTPPSAGCCVLMLSGRRTHHRCCEQHMFMRLCACLLVGEWQMLLRANNLLPNIPWKPARVGVRA